MHLKCHGTVPAFSGMDSLRFYTLFNSNSVKSVGWGWSWGGSDNERNGMERSLWLKRLPPPSRMGPKTARLAGQPLIHVSTGALIFTGLCLVFLRFFNSWFRKPLNIW